MNECIVAYVNRNTFICRKKAILNKQGKYVIYMEEELRNQTFRAISGDRYGVQQRDKI